MPRPIPCLGYASRTDAAMALKARGLTSRQIANAIGINVTNVEALIASRRRSEKLEKHKPPPSLPAHMARALTPYAESRGITPPELAARILETVIADQLIDAVLDDAK